MDVEGLKLEYSWWWALSLAIGLGIPAFFGLLMLWADGGQIQDLPPIKVESTADMKEKVFEAYQKYNKNKGIFRVKHPAHQFVMLTTESMNELKNRPETEVSALAEIADRFNGKQSGIGMHQPVFRKAMVRHLTRIAHASVPQLLQECSTTLQEEIGVGKDWNSIPLQALCTRIVAKFVGVMIAGREFGHSEVWLRIGPQHVIDSATFAWTLDEYPRWFRPIAALYVKGKEQLKQNHAEMAEFLKPFVEERLKSDDNGKEPTDLLQAIIDTIPGEQQSIMDLITKCILDLSMFATLTTAGFMTAVLLDTGSHRYTQSMLLEEVQTILGGRSFHELTQTDLNKMNKMDSFMKESQRLEPPLTLGLVRKILKPGGIQLSNGLVLPKNTYVAVSAWSILRDPDLFEKPEDFDALRFYKLRQTPGEENKHQFLTLSDTSVNFGAGPHACSGRILVHNEVKIVMSFLLLNYEIKLEEQPEENLKSTKNITKPDAKLSFKVKQGRNMGTKPS